MERNGLTERWGDSRRRDPGHGHHIPTDILPNSFSLTPSKLQSIGEVRQWSLSGLHQTSALHTLTPSHKPISLTHSEHQRRVTNSSFQNPHHTFAPHTLRLPHCTSTITHPVRYHMSQSVQARVRVGSHQCPSSNTHQSINLTLLVLFPE